MTDRVVAASQGDAGVIWVRVTDTKGGDMTTAGLRLSLGDAYAAALTPWAVPAVIDRTAAAVPDQTGATTVRGLMADIPSGTTPGNYWVWAELTTAIKKTVFRLEDPIVVII